MSDNPPKQIPQVLPPGWTKHPDKAIEAIRLERLYKLGPYKAEKPK